MNTAKPTLNNLYKIIELFDQNCSDMSIVAVNPVDDHSFEVMKRSLVHGVKHISACVAGEPDARLKNLAADERVELIECTDVDDAAAKAVALARSGRADVIFKGFINTDNLLHAVLNKEVGLLDPGAVMTHITATDIPDYHKLLIFSDAAVIPYPDTLQIEAIVRYGKSLLQFLGVKHPKLALIHFTEKSNPKFTITTSYAHVIQLADSGALGDISIEGPMDVKTACDKKAAEIKHIEGAVAGDADMLVFADLEAGNTFYKTISLFGKATMAGIICGCRVPIVIPSRADSVESKYVSLALACVAQKAFTASN